MKLFLKKAALLCCLFATLAINAVAQVSESSFEKIEAYYEKGDYKLGVRSNDILINSISASPKSNPLVLARAYFLRAKGSELDGLFKDYEEFMFKGDRELQKANKDDIFQYAKSANCAIEAYLSYGDYVNASKYLGDAYAIIEKGGLKDSNLYYGLKKSSVLTLYKQGFYIKAQKGLTEIIAYSKRAIVKSEMRFDAKTGKAKVVNLSSKELLLRKRHHGRMLNMQAEMFLDNGRYASTDSMLKISEDWIKKNIGTKDLSYVENLFYKGRLAETLGNLKDANMYYDKSYNTLLKTKNGRYKSYSREAILIFEYLIPTYAVTSKHADFRTKSNMFEMRVKRYYGVDNYYYSKILFLEIQQDWMDQKWSSVIKGINKILENPDMIPKVHMDRAELLDVLSDVYVELDQYDAAQAAIEEATAIKL